LKKVDILNGWGRGSSENSDCTIGINANCECLLNIGMDIIESTSKSKRETDGERSCLLNRGGSGPSCVEPGLGGREGGWFLGLGVLLLMAGLGGGFMVRVTLSVPFVPPSWEWVVGSVEVWLNPFFECQK
jgi:hypothetical protein